MGISLICKDSKELPSNKMGAGHKTIFLSHQMLERYALLLIQMVLCGA